MKKASMWTGWNRIGNNGICRPENIKHAGHAPPLVFPTYNIETIIYASGVPHERTKKIRIQNENGGKVHFGARYFKGSNS